MLCGLLTAVVLLLELACRAETHPGAPGAFPRALFVLEDHKPIVLAEAFDAKLDTATLFPRENVVESSHVVPAEPQGFAGLGHFAMVARIAACAPCFEAGGSRAIRSAGHAWPASSAVELERFE